MLVLHVVALSSFMIGGWGYIYSVKKLRLCVCPGRSLGINITKLCGSKYKVQLNGWKVKITKLSDIM